MSPLVSSSLRRRQWVASSPQRTAGQKCCTNSSVGSVCHETCGAFILGWMRSVASASAVFDSSKAAQVHSRGADLPCDVSTADGGAP